MNRGFSIIFSFMTGVIVAAWQGDFGAGMSIFMILLTLSVIKTVE